VVTDVNDYRLDLARKMGVTKAVNVKYEKLTDVVAELGMTEGFDIGLEMSGNPAALSELFKAMNHGGHVAILGIPPQETPVDWNQVIFKGLVIKGIYGREMFETWYKMIAMLQSGLNIKPVMTHHFPVDQYQDAFQIMASGQSGKVILDW
jgi:threonine 3-dehydrogenase